MDAGSVRQVACRVSARQLAALLVLLVMVGMVFGLIGPVLPALANQPYVEGTAVCVDGTVMIEWTAWSWLQTGGPGSGNPDIQIRFDGVGVASGAFTAENGYEFSGQNPWPNPDVQLPDQGPDTVYVLAYAVAPFDNGDGQGTSTRRTVTLPAGFAESCAPASTTTQPPVTTTTESTTTTQPSATTTTAPTTTEAPTTTTTQASVNSVPETGVLGIQVSLPENAQVAAVTVETLPFTGLSSGSMALFAAASAGAGLLLILLAARRKDEKSPTRSWN